MKFQSNTESEESDVDLEIWSDSDEIDDVSDNHGSS